MKVRRFEPGDLHKLLEMNNAAVPAVNELTAEDLLDLINTALVCIVVEIDSAPAGFLLCISEGTDYQSPNYAWLSERLDAFAYTDRICVDAAQRGKRIGDALYGELFRFCAGSDRCFVCEVNTRPANPGSVRFHKRLGFEEFGEQDHGEKAVLFMKRETEPDNQANSQ